jgi:kynurenine formamidase
MRIIDLTHPLDATVQTFPGDPDFAVEPAATIERDGYNVLHVRMGSQTGTHVDAPYHFLTGGARIDEMDLALFYGPAVVADVRGLPPRARITWAHLQPVADRLGAGTVLLLHTGWSRYFRTPRYYDHPVLDADAAERIVAAGVRTLGVDMLNPDPTVLAGEHPGYPVHETVLGADGAIAENLTGLDRIRSATPTVSLLPLKFAGADGAPVRAVAIEDD